MGPRGDRRPTAAFHGAAEGRDNNLDFLRFALAAAVVWSHGFLLSEGSEARDPLFALSRGALTLSRAAVAGFFILSGFLIARSWTRHPNLADFARRRALRILPAYLLVSLVCLAVVAPLSSHAFGGHAGLARDLLLMDPPKAADVFAANPYPGQVNGSLWTIRYELWCYAAVAALGVLRLLSARAAGAVWLAAVLCDAANERCQFVDAWRAVPLVGFVAIWPKFIAYFFAGVTFYLLRARIPKRGTLCAAAAPLLLASITTGNATVVLLGLCTAGAYLLLYAAFSPLRGLRHFGRHGDFSYGVYLYAWPIQQLLVQFAPPLRGPWLLSMVTLCLATACAAFSWHFVEHPFTRRQGRRVDARPTVGVGAPPALAI